MIRKALPRVGWALLGMIALVALSAWFVYLQLLQLDGENRRELARAAREIGATLNELSSTASRALNVPTRLPTEIELDAFADELRQRNPYIADLSRQEFVQRNPNTLAGNYRCSDQRPGLVSPRILAVPARHVVITETGALAKDDVPRHPEGWKVYKFEATPERIFEDVFISRAFEHLFIADAGGKVEFELTHGTSAERRGDRGWLVQRGEGDSGRGRSTTRIENLKALETAPGQTLDLDVVAAASGAYPIYLGDQVYQLYAYPITIAKFREPPAGTNSNCSEETTWIVAGIVDPQRMQEEALTISPQWMLLVFLFFAAVVVGEPFVKLFFLKPTERFRSADAWLLVPSASVLLTLTTIVVLDIGTYGRLKARAATTLEDLATDVNNNVGGELRQMHAQLADFDRELAANQPDVVQDICRGRRMDVMNLLANRASDVRLPRPQYPSTIQVFWLDPMGRQLFKATVLQRGTGRQTVADREYFTEVRDARLWSFDEVTGQPFFTQSLRSITTAELITALSIRSSLSEKCAFDAETKTVVAVVTGVHPTSVERPLLPSGYSFAIIGASGAVLYHSDRRRILKENFFEEFNDPERLQAAVHARTPQRFHTTYARRPTEVFITPFTGIPAAQWFIATLRDEQWLETTNSEALLRTTFWSVAASIPTLAVSLLLLYAGKRSIQHLWPDPGKDSYYKLLVPVYAALLVVGLVGSSFALVGTGLFLLAVLFPLLVILISVAIHLIWVRFPTLDTWVASRAIWHRQHLDGLTHRNWFFIAVAALWACTSVVPAIGLFRYSWTLEIAKFRSLEWNRANQLKESWKAQDDFEWKHVIIEDRSRFLQSRQAYLESYMPQGPVSPVERSWAEQLLDGYLPLYNDVAERLRDQSPGMLAETASSSRRDLLTANVALTWQTLLGAGLTAFIAGWWLRYKDRHLLWARIADARPTRDLTPLAAGCRLAIVAPSERARARLARTFRASTHVAPAHVERSAVPAISIGPSGLTDDVLHRLENIASETYRAQSAATDPATSADVQVDDFEQKVMQPDTRLATLKKLEVCVATKGRAVIICRSDPLHLLNLKSGATGEPQNLRPHLSPLERDRWLAVLESFVVHSAAVEDVDEDEMDSSENHELYFDSLWRYCSQPEKVTLVQVAEEGFANPHQESVVKGLVEKRLMKLEPNLKLKSEAFERFVVRQAGSAQLTAWETPEGALGWRGIRWILAFVVVAVLLFLATTQGAWFRSAAAILTGITVSLEAVSGFIQAINRSRQSLG